MVDEIIEGARYEDRTFDDEFVVADVDSDGRVESDEDVVVTVEYDEMGEMELTLDMLVDDETIEIVEVPGT